jgi:hypothetical protein
VYSNRFRRWTAYFRREGRLQARSAWYDAQANTQEIPLFAGSAFVAGLLAGRVAEKAGHDVKSPTTAYLNH